MSTKQWHMDMDMLWFTVSWFLFLISKTANPSRDMKIRVISPDFTKLEKAFKRLCSTLNEYYHYYYYYYRKYNTISALNVDEVKQETQSNRKICICNQTYFDAMTWQAVRLERSLQKSPGAVSWQRCKMNPRKWISFYQAFVQERPMGPFNFVDLN